MLFFSPRLGKDSWFLLEAIGSILLRSPFVSGFVVVVVVVVVSVREFYFGVFLLLYFLVELLSSLFYFHWDFQGVWDCENLVVDFSNCSLSFLGHHLGCADPGCN